ncbi:GNAT family N-acetyltransferase [Roseomonas sp. M0104]|uniref:GNAT family N-acetyltransferase n=1 Tax=Teichococcus coralli TaxID=2545983 RepID=A0A845BD67_9PROT|nr:GNAT family N-acetyltransferase [Pseudoroseomonas coralli]MXP64678.1 GNAT family N-acetyltransferase [Pseudoroseomonas coralli]
MIEELTAETLPAAVPALAALLRACVGDGASIGFLLPMREGEAEGFWQGQAAALREGSRRVLVARGGASQGGRILGTGALALAGMPNGRHRAEISKVMVHPEARRQGIGRAVMLALEALARDLGRPMLVLDTRSGDAGEALYRSLGWRPAGQVPGYALDNDGSGVSTTFMYKRLGE